MWPLGSAMLMAYILVAMQAGLLQADCEGPLGSTAKRRLNVAKLYSYWLCNLLHSSCHQRENSSNISLKYFTNLSGSSLFIVKRAQS